MRQFNHPFVSIVGYGIIKRHGGGLAVTAEVSLQRRESPPCEDYLKRKLFRERSPIVLQPISLMSRSISVRIKLRARSTPACPAAARG
jgi:hypothetical protein